ncbi:hypothetical protein [Plantactinospora sp. DSM 117369]
MREFGGVRAEQIVQRPPAVDMFGHQVGRVQSEMTALESARGWRSTAVGFPLAPLTAGSP